jgi:hypothetical protein
MKIIAPTNTLQLQNFSCTCHSATTIICRLNIYRPWNLTSHDEILELTKQITKATTRTSLGRSPDQVSLVNFNSYMYSPIRSSQGVAAQFHLGENLVPWHPKNIDFEKYHQNISIMLVWNSHSITLAVNTGYVRAVVPIPPTSLVGLQDKALAAARGRHMSVAVAKLAARKECM